MSPGNWQSCDYCYGMGKIQNMLQSKHFRVGYEEVDGGTDLIIWTKKLSKESLNFEISHH